MPTPPRVSRRTTLGGVAALTAMAVSGCTGDTGSAHPSPTPSSGAGGSEPRTSRVVQPDVRLAASVLGNERAMLDRVQATVRRHPSLAGALAGARAGHHAHVVLLTKAVPDQAPSPAPARRVRRSQVPSRPRAALLRLARAEARLGADGRRGAVAAESGAFARVLASMAAASAQQATHLAAVARDRR